MPQHDRRLIELLPGFQAATEALHEETIGIRTALINQLGAQSDHAQRLEAELASAAAALNTRASKLREQLAEVDAELANNLSALAKVKAAADAQTRDLQAQLRRDFMVPIQRFQSAIDQTHNALNANLDGARVFVLGSNGVGKHANKFIVQALQELLKAHRGLDSIAFEHADVDAAISKLRAHLASAGIRLIESSATIQ